MGPFFLLLYLNNLTRSFEALNFENFADDTPVFLSYHSLDPLYVNFNEELYEVSEWLRVNRLSINVDQKPAI